MPYVFRYVMPDCLLSPEGRDARRLARLFARMRHDCRVATVRCGVLLLACWAAAVASCCWEGRWTVDDNDTLYFMADKYGRHFPCSHEEMERALKGELPDWYKALPPPDGRVLTWTDLSESCRVLTCGSKVLACVYLDDGYVTPAQCDEYAENCPYEGYGYPDDYAEKAAEWLEKNAP